MNHSLVPFALSGVWEGVSVSNNNVPTQWKKTHLRFIPHSVSGTSGTVVGQGTSFWKMQQIDFDIKGTYDMESHEIVLVKQHKGTYNNSVKYKALLDVVRGALTGTYPNGKITLVQRQEKSLFSGVPLSGAWEGFSIAGRKHKTYWEDTQLTFRLCNNEDTAKVSGAGHSLMRGLAVDFRVDGLFSCSTQTIRLRKSHTGAINDSQDFYGKIWLEGNDVVIRGICENGTIELRKRKEVDVEDILENLSRQENHRQENISSEIMAQVGEIKENSELIQSAMATLNGTWSGSILDKDGTTIDWIGVSLHVEHVNGHCQLAGRGSFRCDKQRSEHRIHGNFNPKTRLVKLVVLMDDANCDKKIELQAHVVCSNQGITMTGSSANGTMELAKTNGPAQPSGDINTQNDQGTAKKLSAKHSSVLADSRLLSYRAFLIGITSSGTIVSRELDIIKQYRTDYCITDEEHESLLDNIGLSMDKFDRMVQLGKTDPLERELCKICFSEAINTIILPCGHFSLCLHCASHELDRCPICRIEIESMKRVYRV